MVNRNPSNYLRQYHFLGIFVFKFRLNLNKQLLKTNMITVSENAKQHALNLIKNENRPEDTFIRVGVAGGGCSGLSYKLEFDTLLKEGDQIFEDKGIKIVVDKKSFLYLIGTELDYSGGLNGKGFVFNNPNASRTCGCGESFGV